MLVSIKSGILDQERKSAEAVKQVQESNPEAGGVAPDAALLKKGDLDFLFAPVAPGILGNDRNPFFSGGFLAHLCKARAAMLSWARAAGATQKEELLLACGRGLGHCVQVAVPTRTNREHSYWMRTGTTNTENRISLNVESTKSRVILSE